MRWVKFNICIILLAMVGGVSSCYNHKPERCSKKISASNGVKLEVSTPGTVAPGSSVEIIITLANSGNKPVFHGQIDGVSELGIRLSTLKGDIPALTPLGKARLGKAPGSHKYNVKSIEPGRSQVWRIDLAKLFILPPDSYTVSVSMELDRHLKPSVISVGGVTFKIGRQVLQGGVGGAVSRDEPGWRERERTSATTCIGPNAIERGYCKN
jgi:hypothetical protein